MRRGDTASRGGGGGRATPAPGPRSARGTLSVLHLSVRSSLASTLVGQMLDTASAQVGRGHAVTIVSRPDADLAVRCTAVGARLRPLPLRGAWDGASLRRLRRILVEEGADVLHAWGRAATLTALVSPHRHTRPVVVVEHRTSFPPGLLTALVYRSRRVDRVVAACEAVRQVILSHASVPPHRVEVVYPAVDVDRLDPARCDPARIRAELSLGGSEALIGHVGMDDWRGWKELLRALPAVVSRRPDAHLVLAGCRNDRHRRTVLEAANEMGVGDRVSVVPPLTDARNFLAACAVVVDPSWAGIGISASALQAMALARPVVATTVAGNVELIESGVSGLLTEPHDVASLAAAIARLLDDPDAASRLGRAARRRVRARFTPEARGARLERVYRHALRDRHRASPH